MFLVKLPVPLPEGSVLLLVVGFCEVLQHTPREVTDAPPVAVTLPPQVTEVAVILVTLLAQLNEIIRTAEKSGLTVNWETTGGSSSTWGDFALVITGF